MPPLGKLVDSRNPERVEVDKSGSCCTSVFVTRISDFHLGVGVTEEEAIDHPLTSGAE